MKQKEDEALQQGQLENQLRLHRAGIIKAKAHAFWLSITEKVEADCAELNETFKDDIRRCCRFERRGPEEFTVIGNTAERYALRLHLNLDALGIGEEFFSGQAAPRRVDRKLLEFGVDKNENLYVRGLSGQLADPGYVSELIIKRVIQQ
jgi:hypothetical protein